MGSKSDGVYSVSLRTAPQSGTLRAKNRAAPPATGRAAKFVAIACIEWKRRKVRIERQEPGDSRNSSHAVLKDDQSSFPTLPFFAIESLPRNRAVAWAGSG